MRAEYMAPEQKNGMVLMGLRRAGMPTAVVAESMALAGHGVDVLQHIATTGPTGDDVRHVSRYPTYRPPAVAWDDLPPSVDGGTVPTIPREASAAEVCKRLTAQPDAAQFARYTGTNCHREHPSSNLIAALSAHLTS
jgi:hypothetical protein